MDGISRHITVLLLTLSILLTYIIYSFVPPLKAATPPTLYVGPDEIYTNIQDALNDASDGYRIVVYADTYQETLYINHSIDLFGEDRSNTIIDGDDTHTVITINAPNVNISHFTITDTSTTTTSALIQINHDYAIITDNLLTQGHHALIINQSDHHLIYDNTVTQNTGNGIHLIQSHNNVNISYNTITTNQNGIFLYQSGSNHIYHNTIQNNQAHGIFLNHSCASNKISQNTITHNSLSGIYINDYSDWSTISFNTLDNNSHSGIILENCSLSIIADNTITSNTHHGIMLIGSINTIEANTILNNDKDGIYLNADDNTQINHNTISGNILAGIRLYNSTNDIIKTNEISNNFQYGIYLDFFVIDTTIFNNYLHHNTKNAIDKSINKNQWNQSPSTGTNIIGGPIIAGNYWDDFDESQEGVTDTNNNGVCDTSYTIYNLNQDHAPLLDTIPPTIETIEVIPQSQTLGQPTIITVTIIDNTEIKAVNLNISTPDNTRQNLSIIENKNGCIYQSNTIFSTLGTYNFTVHSKDPRNWIQSTQRTFNIIEGRPPTIKDNSPTIGSPSAAFIFNATIIDDKDPPADLNVTVHWYHGTKQGNTTLEHQGNNIFTGTIHLDTSIQPLSYRLEAADHWGNNYTNTGTTVPVVDTTPPSITIHQFTPTKGDLPNTFTYTVSVIDNAAVAKVYMSYWYAGSQNYTVDLENAGNGRYTKTIVPNTSPDRVYCIIYAIDTSDNINTTMKPTALTTGPYTGFVRTNLTVNGSSSYDLDGNITHYHWDFGDGTTGNGSTTTHQYLSSGIYTLTLTVTDNDDNTHTAQTTVTIGYFTSIIASPATHQYLEDRFTIYLPQEFYCFDSDGDDHMDSFVDPNGILLHIHQLKITIENEIAFALSINDMYIPECLWLPNTDEIQLINHQIGIIENIQIDEDTDNAILTVTVNKVDWLYLQIPEQYPYATLSITTGERTIPADHIIRTNGYVYLLDDASTTYQYHYEGIYPPLKPPTFLPPDGGVIDANQTTITISFEVPVQILDAQFGNTEATNQLKTVDNKIFTYTPPGYLKDGTITFTLTASAVQGKQEITAHVVYFYFSYTTPPPPSFLDLYKDYILFSLIIGSILLSFYILYHKRITLDGYIYFKNKRVLPFFKTVVFGPLSVHVDNTQISKAEFYLDGKLKYSTTQPPFLWHWNEQAMLKHTLETKVYDAEGNNVSSGVMPCYIFNLYTSQTMDDTTK